MILIRNDFAKIEKNVENLTIIIIFFVFFLIYR